MKMVDMKRTPEKAKMGELAVSPSDLNDKYDYGLRVSLNADNLKKLGIKDLPTVGDEYHLVAVSRVISTSKNASETNESARVELQITFMQLVHEDEQGSEKKDTADAENKEVFGAKPTIKFK